jgi:hypothetical protein
MQYQVFVPSETLLNVLFQLIFTSLSFIHVFFHVFNRLFFSPYLFLDLVIFIFESLRRICENHVFLELNLGLNFRIVSFQ